MLFSVTVFALGLCLMGYGYFTDSSENYGALTAMIFGAGASILSGIIMLVIWLVG